MEIISPLLHQTCIGLFVFLLLLAGWTDLTIPNQLPVALFVLAIPFGMTSQGGHSSNSLDLNTLIDALDDEGLITVLAKTNLTTLSSKPATFLAGDEFLIVVPFST
jgi:Flp pilus assembly secretin CpaC